MVQSLALILLCQLVGETVAAMVPFPLPGPVIGMLLLIVLLLLRPGFCATLRPVAQGVLSHLSLLFVPAGVGIFGYFSSLGDDLIVLFLAVIVSTVSAIIAGALTFVMVVRLMRIGDD